MLSTRFRCRLAEPLFELSAAHLEALELHHAEPQRGQGQNTQFMMSVLLFAHPGRLVVTARGQCSRR